MIVGDILDLRSSALSGGGELSPTTVTIIEQNLDTQVDHKILYTEIEWLNGLPSVVRKYEDSTKTKQLFEITPTWIDGLPTQVVTNNLDDGIITTTTITWVDGVPTTINKEEA
jgi:hypothetical protein